MLKEVFNEPCFHYFDIHNRNADELLEEVPRIIRKQGGSCENEHDVL